MENEQQVIYSTDCKFAAEETDGKMKLVGYPVVFGAMSDVRGDGNRHRFTKGSVDFATPTKALVNHTPGAVVGNTANNTVKITEDNIGYRAEMDLPNTTLGRDTYELVKGGYVGGMSIGGSIKKSTVANGVRDINKFHAREITITDDPAMAATSISAAYMSAEKADEYAAEIKSLSITKERNAQLAKLNNHRLSMYELGKVSGSAERTI